MIYLKKGIKIISWFLLAILLYVVIVLIHGTFTDYQPPSEEDLEIVNDATIESINDSTASFLIWNIGYGNLGAEANFFYDNGRMIFSRGDQVNAPKKDVEKNINGFLTVLQKIEADFYLLQEIDLESKRSRGTNQFIEGLATKDGYEGTFSMNYNAKRIPLPILEPWNVIGKIKSGLGTYSKYELHDGTRYQLPGEYSWPIRMFQLDRCMATHRVKLQNGKELLVINMHNSAYDKGGIMKKQQMQFIRDFVVKEYQKGNYVVVGGDWNQCPPKFDYRKFAPNHEGDYFQYNISSDYYPDGWTWAYDSTVATNRKLNIPYEKATAFTTLIDFYLVSPNLKIQTVKGIDLDFAYSDHQPVYLEVKFD